MELKLLTGVQAGNTAATLVDVNGVNPTTPGSFLSDTLFFQRPSSAVMFGVTGSVQVMFTDNSVATLKVTAGALYPFALKRIYASGLTSITSADIFIFFAPKGILRQKAPPAE